MAEFNYFQADVDTTNTKFEEEVNDDRDEVNSLIDDLFMNDNVDDNPCFYYQIQNVSNK